MSAGAGFFESPFAHLEGEIRRIRALVRLRVAIDRKSGRLPSRADAIDRGFISGDAVEAVLADVSLSDEPEVSLLRAGLAQASDELAVFSGRSAEVGVILPLMALSERFQLSYLAKEILTLAIVAEVDGGIRQALGYLQNDITRQFVDLELVGALFCQTTDQRFEAREELSPDAPLMRAGLMVPPLNHRADDLSVLRMPLRPSRHIVDFILGQTGVDPLFSRAARIEKTSARVDLLGRLTMSDDATARIRSTFTHVKGLIARGMPPIVRVQGPEGTGKSVVVATLGQALEMPVLTVDARGLPFEERSLFRRLTREAVLHGALLHLEHLEAVPTELRSDLWRQLDSSPELTIALESRDLVPLETERQPISVTLALPTHAERTTIWRLELNRRGLPRDLAGDLAGRYRVSGKTIATALDDVMLSAVEQRPPSEVIAAVRDRVAKASDHRLGALATRISTGGSWRDLVLPETTTKQLDRLISHFRHRTKLMVDWGFEARLATGHGISALFQGPPGTGKTLAAGVIAREFDLELYQVDVSRIVSKWLGETEKNLASIFDEAERAQAILLFDEADSLFSKRTEVQSSNDRHANLEVNFLLQRMDSFRGITLLTTNFAKSIDEAFARRMTFRIDFPEPGAAERERLWEFLMPKQMEKAEAFDFEHLAKRFEMSGGHIRNAILKAAIEAASDGTGVTMKHLIDAGNMEYRAMGRLLREDV